MIDETVPDEATIALPGAIEQPHHGSPSFRVGGKIFAQLSSDGLTALLKLPLSLQEWGRAGRASYGQIFPIAA
ncbi:MmcQ/YjbR family DNA-binding protein [Sphingobium mellinum]|uniref:MmcQ/YjbR family DNA-binding protein n=1 Tax=Sphingobium mellinum TaxID=1387166 RepID=UPI0030EEC77A